MVNVADYSQSNLGKLKLRQKFYLLLLVLPSEIDGITGHFAELSKTNLEKISRKPL